MTAATEAALPLERARETVARVLERAERAEAELAAERQRADAAEAEAERLRALLAGPEILSPGDAARRLSVSRKTLYRLEARGKITPSRTPAGQRRYLAGDVEALRREREGAGG